MVAKMKDMYSEYKKKQVEDKKADEFLNKWKKEKEKENKKEEAWVDEEVNNEQKNE